MRISVNDIKNNMIVDEDIYNSNGKLILSRGLSISDEDHIKKLLLRNSIDKVNVLVLFDALEEEKKEHENETAHVDFASVKKHDTQEFMSDFSKAISNFEDEIIKSISGDTNSKSLELLLEETINSNSNKNVNIFQLLQKFKDSDDLTFTHCNSVSLTVHTIGKWHKLPQQGLNDLSLAGLLFDIGKYTLPKELLNKTEPISPEEFEILKSHVNNSLDMLSSYELNKNITDAIKYHHERCDGSGYPYGLSGDQIPLHAKILALADVFVALTSWRPYRNKLTPFEAVKLLETDFMQKLDIVILSDFINRIASSYIGCDVELDDGRKGEILFINSTMPLRPIIKLIPSGDIVDLSDKSNINIDIKEFL